MHEVNQPSTNSVIIVSRVTPEIRDAFGALAARENRTISAQVRHLMIQALSADPQPWATVNWGIGGPRNDTPEPEPSR